MPSSIDPAIASPNSNSVQAGASTLKSSLLWARAFAELSEKDRMLFGSQPNATPGTATQSISDTLKGILDSLEAQRDRCQHNNWKTRSVFTGQEIIVRDVYARIVSCVSRFMSVADVVVSFDPVHAALPWAAVRLVLQLCTNNFKAFDAVVEGVEKAAGIIAKCTIIEVLYLLSPGETESAELRAGLEASLGRLYAAILGFLCKAISYYNSTPIKKVANLSIKQSLDDAFKAIGVAEDGFLVQKSLVDGERIKSIQERSAETSLALTSIAHGIQKIQTGQDMLQEALTHLQQPFVRTADQISDIYDAMKVSERATLLKWLSKVPVQRHYRAVLTGLIPNSGQWLLHGSAFTSWRDSSVSETFWLHGLPGYGKSKLAAAVIHHLRNRGVQVDYPAPVAHFFCLRDSQEPERSDASEVLRSLVKQLSLTEDEDRIRRPTVSKYEKKRSQAKRHGESPEVLTTQECVELIIELGRTTSATIIIDGLDECSSSQRGILLSAFNEIQERCRDVMKIFVSSRFTEDIAACCRKAETTEVTAETTRADLSEFVKHGVDEVIKKWVSVRRETDATLEKLRASISSTLMKGAQGMFLWVSLQLANISDFDRIKTRDDIEAALASLPPSLSSSYAVILEKIEKQGEVSKQVAKAALRWLLCAKRPLTYPEFVAAVEPLEGPQSGVAFDRPSVDSIIASCCNLVAVELVSGQSSFRLAHLTVREFLESLEEYDDAINQLHIGRRCLETYCLWRADFRQDALLAYSTKYWPAHVEPAQAKLISLLKVLFVDEEHFVDWLETLRELLTEENTRWSSEYDTKLDACLSPMPSPLFTICCFGLTEAFRHPNVGPALDLEQRNKNGTSGLLLAARWGHTEVVHELLENDVDPIGTGRFGTAMTSAAFAGHNDIVKMLLEKGAPTSGDALQAALENDHETIAKVLLEEGVEFSDHDSFDMALQTASFNGQVDVVQQLLDGRAGKFTVEAASQPDPLQVALYGGKKRQARLLLQSYVNMDEQINEQKGHFGNALAAAIASGRLDLVEEIVEAGARVDQRGRFGYPLRAAAVADQGHRVDIVKYLLERTEADPNQRDEELGDALQAAASRGDCDVMLLLLSYGADVDGGPGGSFGNTMQAAAYGGHTQAVHLLLDHHASFTSEGVCGAGRFYDALTAATWAGQQHIVTLLLDRGATERLCRLGPGYANTIRILDSFDSSVNNRISIALAKFERKFGRNE